MNAIAPNLTALVGELVGARLIAHAGSLMSLAKQPASTVQILGAEKALFRALKTKKDTPKYGLIYHASLIGQAGTKNKGKISRVLAAKAALSIRVDALGDKDAPAVGAEGRAKVEARLRQLEGKSAGLTLGGASANGKKTKKMEFVKSEGYNAASDVTISAPSKKQPEIIELSVRVATPDGMKLFSCFGKRFFFFFFGPDKVCIHLFIQAASKKRKHEEEEEEEKEEEGELVEDDSDAAAAAAATAASEGG
jgi:hypothetical protein